MKTKTKEEKVKKYRIVIEMMFDPQQHEDPVYSRSELEYIDVQTRFEPIKFFKLTADEVIEILTHLVEIKERNEKNEK